MQGQQSRHTGDGVGHQGGVQGQHKRNEQGTVPKSKGSKAGHVRVGVGHQEQVLSQGQAKKMRHTQAQGQDEAVQGE